MILAGIRFSQTVFLSETDSSVFVCLRQYHGIDATAIDRICVSLFIKILKRSTQQTIKNDSIKRSHVNVVNVNPKYLAVRLGCLPLQVIGYREAFVP